MIGKQLVIGAAALNFALASAVPVRDVQAAETGQGFWDAYACAACLVIGGFAVAAGGVSAAAYILVVGGPAAVALVTGVTACARECVAAFE